jgi:glycosyltransferase involved in cell wall biosynthesis
MIEKFVCSLSTWVEPDSNSNLRFAHSEKLYPENKGSVIWNGSASGVNLDKFDINKKEQYNNEIREKYNLPSEAFVYGFVGRITKDKGINELLYSFKRINEECKNVYLILVGPNEVTQGIDEELYEWSLNSLNVIYTGFTNEVEKYISAMDVYILPSYREGFGSGVIEAEAMGVPVIVSDIPGPTDAMKNGKTGIIVKKADAQSLYTAMKNVFEEKDKCSVMADNAIEFVKSSFEQKTLFSYMLDDRKKLLGE